MILSIIEQAVYVALIYLAVGLVVALPIVLAGVRRLDPAAAGTGPAFRALILPGTAIFWPLLLSRWIRSRRTTTGSTDTARTQGREQPQ